MGDCFVTHPSGESVQVGDDGRCADLTPEERRAFVEHEAERARRSRETMARACEQIDAACGPEAGGFYRDRAARRRARLQHEVEEWARRFKADPCLLECIRLAGSSPLARWEAPERIKQVCHAALNEPGADEAMLRGAVLFAEREIKAEAAEAREPEHA